MPIRNPHVEVHDNCRAGRGVRAREAITAGTVIELCPVIVTPAEQVNALDQTAMYDYYFAWADGAAAIALGYGSLYNHDPHPNADYIKDFDQALVQIIALSDIATGDEVLVDYSRGGTNPLWFDPIT